MQALCPFSELPHTNTKIYHYFKRTKFQHNNNIELLTISNKILLQSQQQQRAEEEEKHRKNLRKKDEPAANNLVFLLEIFPFNSLSYFNLFSFLSYFFEIIFCLGF